MPQVFTCMKGTSRQSWMSTHLYVMKIHPTSHIPSDEFSWRRDGLTFTYGKGTNHMIFSRWTAHYCDVNTEPSTLVHFKVHTKLFQTGGKYLGPRTVVSSPLPRVCTQRRECPPPWYCYTREWPKVSASVKWEKWTNQKGKEEQEVGCIEHFQAVYTNFLLVLTTALWGVRIHREVAPTHTREHPHTHTLLKVTEPGCAPGPLLHSSHSSIPPLCLLLQGVKPLVKLPNTAAAT